MWNDEQGYHFVVGGIHWIAQYRIERPDWTPEQERAANKYLIYGWLAVLSLITLDLLIIASAITK